MTDCFIAQQEEVTLRQLLLSFVQPLVLLIIAAVQLLELSFPPLIFFRVLFISLLAL